MIQMQSVLEVADNSGAKSILTMSVLGQARTIAGVGDIITGRRPHCGEDSPSGRFVPEVRQERRRAHRQGQKPRRNPYFRAGGA